VPPRRRTSASPQASEARRAIGAILRAWRLERDLMQDQLAAALGIPEGSFVSQFETGHRRVPAELYRPYAEALGREPRDFAQMLMQHYEPHLHRMLFGPEAGTGTGSLEPTPQDSPSGPDSGRIRMPRS
jgi:transcriptional regulator with XRE-family HTH domain